MYDSPLYVEDRNSFLLYPDRELPGFLEMNRLPKPRVDRNPLLRALAAGSEPTPSARQPAASSRCSP